MKHWPIRSRLALWTAVFLTIELLIFGIASGWVIYKDQLEAFAAIRNHPTSPTVVRKETGELVFDLTGREFSLLECLMRAPGRVFTRTQLCQHVWEYQFDAGTNLVEVYIQRLRRKFDDSEPTKLIQTVRGAGYRIGDTT